MRALKNKLYRDLVIKQLSAMTAGRLSLVLPDGQKLIFGMGSESAEVGARILREDFFSKCVHYGDVGFGEAFVDGDWDTDDITGIISWMILNVENHPTMMDSREKKIALSFLGFANHIRHAFKTNTISNSRKNIAEHYDLGNDFFGLFLDPGMTYSSAYFSQEGESLEDAQERKYAQLCRKLRLKAGDHVLEIGSGWGGFALHAVKHHRCKVTTITISKEQHAYANERFRQAGLGEQAEAKLIDYRHVQGQYDKIASIEMIEAVGHDHLNAYFTQCHNLLKKGGLLGLQMILAPDHRYESFRKRPDWIQKHIFPGGFIPSFEVVLAALRRTGDLGLLDYEDMTPHYARTLNTWRQNFAKSSTAIKTLGFDAAFIRKWNYYFSYCEAAFKMRNISVVQAVFTRPNNHNL